MIFFRQTYHHFNVKPRRTLEINWSWWSPWQCLRSQGWEGEARATVCHSASKCTRDWDIETHPMRAILISHHYYAAYTLLELCICIAVEKQMCLQAHTREVKWRNTFSLVLKPFTDKWKSCFIFIERHRANTFKFNLLLCKWGWCMEWPLYFIAWNG